MKYRKVSLHYWLEYIDTSGSIEHTSVTREYPLDFLLSIGKTMQTSLINTELENLYETVDAIALLNEGVNILAVTKPKKDNDDFDIGSLFSSNSNDEVEVDPRLNSLLNHI